MLNPDIHIRPMGERDINDAVNLLAVASATDSRALLLSHLGEDADPAPLLALVAERKGVVVGAVSVRADPVFPGTVSVLAAVAADERGAGIGSVLAERADKELRKLPGQTATFSLRDDLPRGRAFAERHGFALAHHSLGFQTPLVGSDASLTTRATETAAKAGVRVRAAAIASEENLITECFTRCRTGLPLPYGNRPVDVRERLRQFPRDTVYLLAESTDPSAERCMGMSVLIPQGANWYVRFTGTDPDFRARGVATAVKTASLLHAHRAGAERLTTHNDRSNLAIIRANKALGMLPDVGYWSFTRDL
jgi:predicted N-acetyltransferase YhbS